MAQTCHPTEQPYQEHHHSLLAWRYAQHGRGGTFVQGWKHALTPSSHLVKFVPALRFNSLLYTWLVWNPAEHDHTALGVSEGERGRVQTRAERESAPY